MNLEEKNQVESHEALQTEEVKKIIDNKQKFNWKVFSFTLLGFIVSVSLIAGAFYYNKQQNIDLSEEDLTPEEEQMVWDPSEDTDVDDRVLSGEGHSTSTEVSEDMEDERPSILEFAEKESSVKKYDLVVEWLSIPVDYPTEDLPVANVARVYKVGTVKNGPLQGETIYLFYGEGMGRPYPVGIFVLNPSVIEVTWWTDDATNLPDSIISADNKIKLIKNDDFFASLIDIENMSDADRDTFDVITFAGLESLPENQLYVYKECFFARTPSDLIYEYIINIPFIEDDKEGSYTTPEIIYNRTDGNRMMGEYEIYNIVSYGCGSLCSPLKVVDRTDNDFVKTGVTDDGSELYVLKNVNDERYKELYTQENTRSFVDTSDGQYNALDENKYSYDEFIDMAPLLYWKDPLGRWVEFVNTEFIILAEKCKPVIYLYPEEETDLHVEVKPKLGFTKTIPEYKDGWNVTAYPDGTITDKETGKDYSYLYWSGLVDGYPLIEEGWVVSQKDLPAFFDYYLPFYGLREEERNDFTEYWIESMTESPYYAVTFVEQSIIDELSPLSIDKEPDVVIRLLMTAKPLQKPIKLNPPQLPETPERKGFTVVEWGGVMLR